MRCDRGNIYYITKARLINSEFLLKGPDIMRAHYKKISTEKIVDMFLSIEQ